MATEKTLFSPAFLRLCGSSLLFFASFTTILAELPDYLRSLGGESYVGFIIFLFTLTALISRPFSGKWADGIGRVKVMVFGAIVSAICGFLYLFAVSVYSFLALRLLHGFATGFTPTGSSAYVADIVPVSKRGEAMGLISLAGSLGMAVGPALGSWIFAYYGYEVLFFSSGILGVLAVIGIAGLPETLKGSKRFERSMFRVRKDEFYEPRVLAPAFVLLMTVFAYGAMVTLIPDRCKELGLVNKGLFFTVFTVASIFVRFSAGRISDRIGRERVLLASTALIFVAMLLLGFASNITMLMVGAVFYGLGNGINSPTVMAWAIDLSHENFMGRAMATVYMALELGIGLGALLAGSLYGFTSLWVIFAGCALCCLVAFIFLVRRIWWG